MEVKKALEPTGKVRGATWEASYARLKGGVLTQYGIRDDEDLGSVDLNCILDTDWFPYHEVKEIRPEMAGELWREEGGNMWATRPSGTKGEISIGCISTWGSSWCKYAVNAWHGKSIHGKDGWKRVIPPVEDESVERIEIEEVTWHDILTPKGLYCYPESEKGFMGNLRTKPPMKMILEFPKEK